MRVTGLDDSMTTEDVAAAVARDGGCSGDSIKVEIIRPTQRGLITWDSARAEVMQPRTLRCLQNRHVRAQCTAKADRSEECYRCGKPGQKANTCTDAPKCSVCAAANRPAENQLESKACSPPKNKKG
ncbi:uncharacterized protein [Epargyreus clarus]|uniref:uncharacterized protein n=1 Tax=Epargyreus clarus TaxID=520877 RepID=UPI003C307296